MLVLQGVVDAMEAAIPAQHSVDKPPVQDHTAHMNTESAEAFERFGNPIDVAAFEHDVTLRDWVELYDLGELHDPFWFRPFAEVNPSQLKAAAHTDTNLIQPSVVITDTTGTPYAGFDMRDTPNRKPGVAVHFLPSDFGFTQPGTYVVTFYVDTTGGVRLVTGVNPGLTVNRPTSDSRTGQHTVTFTFVSLAPTQPVYAEVSQSVGTQWAWYRTTLGYPPLIVKAQ